MDQFKELVTTGRKAGLENNRLYLCIEYMTRCFQGGVDSGYMATRTKRFSDGTEITSSDHKSQGILGEIMVDWNQVYQRIEQEWVKHFG